MRQFILIMICILLQVIHVHAGSKDITWKWDYSEADDIFIDLLGKAATGFMETNTPNCYGGKLVVKLPEGLHFKQTEAPAFLLIGNAEEIAFNVDVNDSMAILSLKTSSVQTVPSEAINITLNPKAIKGKLRKGMNTTGRLSFHPSEIPTVFKSPITGRTYHLVFNDEFDDGVIDTLKWDTRSRRSPFTRRGMYQEKPTMCCVMRIGPKSCVANFVWKSLNTRHKTML